MKPHRLFSAECRDCLRLAQHLDGVRLSFPEYYARPVPAFGAEKPHLVIVGLAPGMHGANRTGRPFTGDYAGILLYETLHAYGYATLPISTSADDDLQLRDCVITNAVKCLPPENKPTGDEVKRCNRYLRDELDQLEAGSAILALGRIAHQSVLLALALRSGDFPFSHGARHELRGGLVLFDSYHCSRYNTQTKRLTPQMFREVFDGIRHHLAVK